MASALGADFKVGRIERLNGGIATSVHLVELATSAGNRQVVLKRFPPGSPVPQIEWDALEFVARTALPSPTPLLLNTGEWFNAPCIVTDYLLGRPDLKPDDLGRWIASLATALAAIHSTPVQEAPAWLHRPAIWDRWEPSGLPPGPRTMAISAAVNALRTREWTYAFCHGDFHPGNVLFENGSLIGVVDWTSARVAPLLSDLGRARAALAIWPGGDAPDLLADAYLVETGRPLEGLALWDLMSGSITLENSAVVPLLYEGLSVPVTSEAVATRASGFVDEALRHLS